MIILLVHLIAIQFVETVEKFKEKLVTMETLQMLTNANLIVQDLLLVGLVQEEPQLLLQYVFLFVEMESLF